MVSYAFKLIISLVEIHTHRTKKYFGHDMLELITLKNKTMNHLTVQALRHKIDNVKF